MPRKPKYIVPPGKKYCPYPTHKGPRVMDITEFNGGYCKSCYRDFHREWSRKTQTDTVRSMMEEAVPHYGGRCIDCGETDIDVLRFYPSIRGGVRSQLYHLRTNNYPPGYRLLCANCRMKQVASTQTA